MTTASAKISNNVKAIELSAVLPVFAERESVAELVASLCSLVQDELKEIIIVVAESSPVETFTICERLAKEYPLVRVTLQRQNPGLGYAVRQGIAEAEGTHILLMDTDGEMDPETVPLMVEKIKKDNHDIVVASRWIKGGGVEGYDRFKYFLNRGFQFIFRILYRTNVHDLTLGFKLCRADIFKSILFQAQFHDIGCETTLRVLRRKGCHASEVPTVWRRRKEGESKNMFRRNFLYVFMALSILINGNVNHQSKQKI